MVAATYLNPITGEQWVAKSEHAQTDTGLGFTCDVGVLPLVLALNHAGMQTIGSCEATDECALWPEMRRKVFFTHGDLAVLIAFCTHMRDSIGRFHGLGLTIDFTRYSYTPNPSAVLSCTPQRDEIVLAAIAAWRG